MNQNYECIWFQISNQIVISGWYARSCNLSVAINDGGTYALTGLISASYGNNTYGWIPLSFSTLLQNGLDKDRNETISWSGFAHSSSSISDSNGGGNSDLAGILAWWIRSDYPGNLSNPITSNGKDYFYPSKVTL